MTGAWPGAAGAAAAGRPRRGGGQRRVADRRARRRGPLSLDLKIVELQLAAALFGIGLGSVLALIERAGWRLITAVALFLLLFVIRPTPLTPLLRMSTHPSTLQTSVTSQVAWPCLPGLLLVAAAAFLVTRLT